MQHPAADHHPETHQAADHQADQDQNAAQISSEGGQIATVFGQSLSLQPVFGVQPDVDIQPGKFKAGCSCLAVASFDRQIGGASIAVFVAQVLLQAPDVDVNNKTPYDMASSDKALRNLIASVGGIPSCDPTGQTAGDEPNARAREGLASEARRKRAAEWRN